MSAWGMPKVDRYSTIGFTSSSSAEEQVEIDAQIIDDPDTKIFPACPDGYEVLHLSTKSGAELWGGINAGRFFGNDPHFAGTTRIRVKLETKIEREYGEGLFQVRPVDASPFQCGFGFYCPTYRLVGKNLVLPTTTTIQVAAFAHDVAIFDSLHDFEKFNKKEKAKGKITMAAQSLAPAHLFANTKDEREETMDKAIFTGHVVRAELKMNERTGQSFYWALVETLGGCQFDVVIHPSRVSPNHPPRPGSIIQGAFFLSGRLLPEEDDTMRTKE